MSVKFSNNATTTLASSATSSATSITVADGSVFPTLSANDYFYLTLETFANTAREIVKCTAKNGNILTVVRAQDSTSASAFSIADKVELRLTAAGLNDVATQADTDTNTTYSIQDGELSQNNFTDADHTKLNGVEASADVTDTVNVVAALTAGTNVAIASDGTISATDTNTTYSIQDGELSQNNFTNADHTKLDGIEASADVTDTANVTAAGALMDSEITNLAQVKAFDSSDYATAAQGTLATNALPLAGGTLTGPLIINETTAVKMSAGTTAQRPSGVAGQFRYNTTEGKFEGYSTEWGEIGGGAADLKLNSFTGNGSTTAYTLSSSPAEDNTLVYIDGVYQNKTVYSIVDNVLTFSEAPATSAAIEITAATIAPVEASTEFKLNQFTGNGSTTAFTLSSTTLENNTSVYWDGVYQSKSNYSIAGTAITFSTAPPSGVLIEVMAAIAVIVSVSTPDDGTVTTAKIVDANVTTAKIADANVTTAKLLDANVTTAKIANDAVTADKIASEAIAVGISSVVTATSLTATVNTHVYVSAAGQTITLPASPTIGQRVLVTVGNFVNTVIGRNSSNIMSSGTDMTLDSAYLSIQFIYTDSTQGWVMS